jgi:hypothetical protein
MQRKLLKFGRLNGIKKIPDKFILSGIFLFYEF